VPFFNTNRAKSGPKSKGLRVNDPNVSYIFKNDIIEKYDEIFLKNINKVQSVIARYIKNNASLYGTRAPTVRIPFTDYDKADLFKAAGIEQATIQKSINELKANDIDLRNRVINDPFNELCSLLTGFYYRHKDQFKKPKDPWAYPYHFTSLYLAMRFYCSAYYRSFPNGDPSPDVMDYTIENLSRKYLLRKVNNVFDIVRYYSETNIENREDELVRGADIDYVYYTTSLSTRIGGFMKSLAAQFYKNYEANNRTQTETANRQDEEGEFFVGQTSNISSVLESAVRKIITRFVSDNTIDATILDSACAKTKFSKPKLVIILNRIRENEKTNPLLQQVLSNIIMYYLIESKKGIDTIRSMEFINKMIELYSVSNTKNEIILKIKKLLEDIIKDNAENILKEGNRNMLDRIKTSLYIYLVLFIAKNIEN
jgi:hypothetical protein